MRKIFDRAGKIAYHGTAAVSVRQTTIMLQNVQPALEFEETIPRSILPARATSRIRYIGSKARIAREILDIVGLPACPDSKFVDVFSGTGTVARQAAMAGWQVEANDHLLSSAILTEAQLLSRTDLPFRALGGYEAAIDLLNTVDSVQGVMFREYSPSGRSASGDRRMYFTVENAVRIDSMRQKIESWARDGLVTGPERSLLLADLLGGANAVANTAGTYGCFLREWNSNALHPIHLAPRTLLTLPGPFRVTNLDAFEVTAGACDVAYLDPPYTKRQYAAYYHILETIAVGDSPEVGGITGLRPWQSKHSPFCYKAKALAALERLIGGLGAGRVVLSYSSEGHITLAHMQAMLGRLGTYTLHTIDNVGRYRPNRQASAAASGVTEYVLDLRKHDGE